MILPTLRQLEYVVAIADHGTFQAALSNGGDELTLQRPDGEVLAHMTYPYGPAGDSWVEEGGTWCRAEATPGAPEASCW